MSDIKSQAAKAYYEGNPIMSDDAFDALPDVSDDEVGHGYVPENRKIVHDVAMLSLQKFRDPTLLLEWLSKIQVSRVALQPKFDGLALSLTYQDGRLVQAATRGNGTIGENVLHTVYAMGESEQIPLFIGDVPGTVTVRGEVVMLKSMLQKLNDMINTEATTYSNPRNAAAGLLRRQDTEYASFLNFFPYEVHGVENEIQWLESQLAFAQITHDEFVVDDLTVETLDSELEQRRVQYSNLDFDTDGVVIKAIATEDRQRLGVSRGYPKWAAAYKFPSVEKETILRNVRWQTGRTGRIVPVAEFDPVLLAGAMVSNATMHNVTLFRELDLGIGDTIIVTRANEVIPQVIGVSHSHERGGEKVQVPTQCLNCDAATETIGRDLVCTNKSKCNVTAHIVSGLSQFGVDGVSVALVDRLLEAGLISDLVDLLGIKESDISDLEGYGETSAENAVQALSVIRDGTVVSWIASLGIPGISWSTSEKLAETFGSLDGLATATFDEIIAIEGFGSSRADAIIEHQSDILSVSNRLRDEFGLVPDNPEKVVDQNSEYSGKSIVLTGSFPTLSRNEAAVILEGKGAIIKGSVTKSVDLVIAGEKAGSKLSKAESLGIQVMSGEDFEQSIK